MFLHPPPAADQVNSYRVLLSEVMLTTLM